MLSQNELSILYNIISDETRTFEAIASTFQKSFAKSDQFKVGVTIWFLLKDNVSVFIVNLKIHSYFPVNFVLFSDMN
jgi:hypothetical protein